MDTPKPRAGLGVLGAGAAVCAVCCAGPILGFVAATGVASVLGAVAFGLVGVIVVAAVAAVLWQRRRRRARECGASGPVQIDAPQLKARRTAGDQVDVGDHESLA
jgi:membrane protein implicated in regulation of membrane protease activity